MKADRRQFLKSIGFGGAALLLFPKISNAAVPRRIAIVGAGLSGLAAGYELQKLGHAITILEAQKRPGGRVLTLREAFAENLHAEAGAARIRANDDLTHKYVREFDLPLIPFYPSNGNFVGLKNGQRHEIGWSEFAKAVEAVVHLEKPEKWQKISGGNDQLPRAFAEKLAGKIKYDSSVVKIQQSAREVKLKFLEKGKIETLAADFLICAVPFSVLRKIAIEPQFSRAKKEIVDKLQYDSAARVFLQTKNKFWRQKNLNGFAFGDGYGEIWDSTFGQNPTRGILAAYLRGDVSEKLRMLPNAWRLRETRANLEKYFPGTNENYETGAAKCWDEDRFALGAWAHTEFEQLPDAQKPEGRIFFAGEHTSVWSASMQGAFDSSRRVVNEITRAAELFAN